MNKRHPLWASIAPRALYRCLTILFLPGKGWQGLQATLWNCHGFPMHSLALSLQMPLVQLETWAAHLTAHWAPLCPNLLPPSLLPYWLIAVLAGRVTLPNGLPEASAYLKTAPWAKQHSQLLLRQEGRVSLMGAGAPSGVTMGDAQEASRCPAVLTELCLSLWQVLLNWSG